MKKSILLLGSIICISIQSISQQQNHFIAINSLNAVKQEFSYSYFNNSYPDKDYDYYMRKSKSSRNIGLILLGSGILISGIGALLSFGDNNTYSESRDRTGAIMLFTGAAAGVASIPFMAIALGQSNKAKLMLSNQKTGFAIPAKVSENITGITMSIPIGK